MGPSAPIPSPRTPGAWVQRQGWTRAEARNTLVASPSLLQPAPSWTVTLAARQIWARLAQGRAASRPGLCQIGPLSRSGALPFCRRTWDFTSRPCRCTQLACLVFHQGVSLPRMLCTRIHAGAPCTSYRSRLRGCFPELGLWAGAQTHKGSHKQPAHVSAGEESARETVKNLKGDRGISLQMWGCIPHPRALGALCSPCCPNYVRTITSWRILPVPFPSL